MGRETGDSFILIIALTLQDMYLHDLKYRFSCYVLVDRMEFKVLTTLILYFLSGMEIMERRKSH